MKRIPFLLGFMLLFATGWGQISIATFRVKSILPADISSWGKDPGSVLLVANKMPFQKIGGVKLVIQIKSNGAIICGYKPQELKAGDSSFAFKTFTASDLQSLMPRCANLSPGNYQLCAQFFNAENNPISKESCKDFTVADGATREEPTQLVIPFTLNLVSPSNETRITEANSKKLLSFSWQLSPKSNKNQEISYRLHVHECIGTQTAEEAISKNPAVIDKSALRVNLSMEFLPADAPGKKFAWTVEATITGTTGQKDRVVKASNAWIFSVEKSGKITDPADQPSKMLSGANADFVLVDIDCIGVIGNQKKYHIKARYENLGSSTDNILINDAQVLPPGVFPGNPGGPGLNLMSNIRQKSGTYNVALTMNDILEANSGTISSFIPVPATFTPSLAPGTNQYFEFDYTTSASSVTFTFYGLVDDSKKLLANRNTRNEELIIPQFPDCPCDFCRDNMLQLSNPVLSDNNNILTLHTNVSIPGLEIMQFKTEIISFYHKPANGNEQCYTCNKNSTSFGNFVSGTLTGTGWSVINGVFPVDPSNNNTHHTLGWWNNTVSPVPFINKPLTLNISLPPASTLSCCEDIFRFCIRYSFTDLKCRTCSFVRCYTYTRKPRPIIIRPDGAALSAEEKQNQ